MSNESEPEVNAVVAPITYPVFDPRNPYVWFRQLEFSFQLRGISKQKTMFQHAFSTLPTDVAAQVIDILDKASEDNPYDTLKKAVISRLSDSQEKRVQQLLSQVELGDRTPSQLLRHMRSLLGETKVDDVILRQLWMKCLPANMATYLASNINRSNLDELAEAADKIQEFSDRPYVHAVGTPTPSILTAQQPDVLTVLLEKLELLVSNLSSQHGDKQRPRFSEKSDSSLKHRNQICYYHRMYGDDAKKCQSGCKYPKTDIVASQENFLGSNVSVISRSTHRPGPASNKQPSFQFPYISLCYLDPINQDLNMAESLNPNCEQPFKTTNSATEFDTELFHTDIRELSQELPEHADDPNPVQDDTHGFLPENATASRKIRDKRKRKTPKTTAVNQQKPSQSNGMVFALNF